MSTTTVPLPRETLPRETLPKQASEHVTVGTDDSYWGSFALTWAARYASLRGAKLHVLRAKEGRNGSDQDPAAALVAASAQSDLIVLGCRGRQHQRFGLGDLVLPTVARAQCDVLIVRGASAAIHGVHRNVTVMISGSDDDAVVLERAVHMAVTYQSHLQIVHAVPETAIRSKKTERDLYFALLHLDNFSEKPKTTLVVKRISPHEVVSRASNTDLVVLGRSRSPVHAEGAGSVTKAALHHAPCPVLVVQKHITSLMEGDFSPYHKIHY